MFINIETSGGKCLVCASIMICLDDEHIVLRYLRWRYFVRC
jgi:hypothetical protein